MCRQHSRFALIDIDVVGIAGELTIKIGMGEDITIGIIGEGFHLSHGQCAAENPAQLVITPLGRAPFCIRLADFITHTIIGIGGDLPQGIGNRDQATERIISILGGDIGLIGASGIATKGIVAALAA